jgi:hypothetical protein
VLDGYEVLMFLSGRRFGTYFALACTRGALDDMAKVWWAEFTKRC